MTKPVLLAEIITTHLKLLSKYIPIVDRVHGDHHPEFHEVRRLFNLLSEKIKGTKDLKPNLNEEFNALRLITDNYTVPDDVCETYETVYKMLAEIDQAHRHKG